MAAETKTVSEEVWKELEVEVVPKTKRRRLRVSASRAAAEYIQTKDVLIAAQSAHAAAREALVASARTVMDTAAASETVEVSETIVEFVSGVATDPTLEVSISTAVAPAQSWSRASVTTAMKTVGLSKTDIACVCVAIKSATDAKPKVNRVIVRSCRAPACPGAGAGAGDGTGTGADAGAGARVGVDTE